DTGEAFARDVSGNLAELHGFMQHRQRLRAQQRRGQQLVRMVNLDCSARQVEDSAGVDDEPGHAFIVRAARQGVGLRQPALSWGAPWKEGFAAFCCCSPAMATTIGW